MTILKTVDRRLSPRGLLRLLYSFFNATDITAPATVPQAGPVLIRCRTRDSETVARKWWQDDPNFRGLWLDADCPYWRAMADAVIVESNASGGFSVAYRCAEGYSQRRNFDTKAAAESFRESFARRARNGGGVVVPVYVNSCDIYERWDRVLARRTGAKVASLRD